MITGTACLRVVRMKMIIVFGGIPFVFDGDFWSIRNQAALTREDLASCLERDTNRAKNSCKGLAIIKLLCDDGPLLYIKDITSAKEVWQKLRDMYGPLAGLLLNI